MKEIIEFYKKVVYTCNNSHCMNCPLTKFKKNDSPCMPAIFNYFFKKNEKIGQKIYNEFTTRLNFDKIPNLIYEKELYEEQLRILERCCKNNILEIE